MIEHQVFLYFFKGWLSVVGADYKSLKNKLLEVSSLPVICFLA